MQIVRGADRRVTTTPNATMTTLASPTLGAAARSLWLVEMAPGSRGPVHSFEDEVVWAVVSGEAGLTCDSEEVVLGAGDTVVLPGGRMRQFTGGESGFTAVVTTPAPGAVSRADGAPSATPAWVA